MAAIFDIPHKEEREGQADAAHRACEKFLVNYQTILLRVESYLEEIIEKTDNAYKEAYLPWKNALHDLLSGTYFIAKDIPLPNKNNFADALCMFSFEGAVTFLRDICSECQLRLKNGWRKEFREHIKELQSSISDTEYNYQI